MIPERIMLKIEESINGVVRRCTAYTSHTELLMAMRRKVRTEIPDSAGAVSTIHT